MPMLEPGRYFDSMYLLQSTGINVRVSRIRYSGNAVLSIGHVVYRDFVGMRILLRTRDRLVASLSLGSLTSCTPGAAIHFPSSYTYKPR